MPTIRKLPSGKWQAIVKCFPHKPTRKTLRTKHLAERWAIDTLDKLQMGNSMPVKSPLLSEAIDKYLEEITPLKADSSLKREQSRARIISQHLGQYRLHQLTSDLILDSYVRIRLESVSPDSVRRELSLLSQLHQHNNSPNPIPDVRSKLFQHRKLSRPIRRDRRLSASEERRLLKSCSSIHPDLVLAVEIILLSGVRRSELCGLTSNNLKKRTLTILQSKNGKCRQIAVSDKLSKLLKLTPLSLKPDSLTHLFKQACDKANIDDLRIHDLRGECAHRWVEKGIPIEFVAQMLGNSVSTCSKHYVNNLDVNLIKNKL